MRGRGDLLPLRHHQIRRGPTGSVRSSVRASNGTRLRTTSIPPHAYCDDRLAGPLGLAVVTVACRWSAPSPVSPTIPLCNPPPGGAIAFDVAALGSGPPRE